MSAEEITLGKSKKGGQRDFVLLAKKNETLKIWKSRHVWALRRY